MLLHLEKSIPLDRFDVIDSTRHLAEMWNVETEIAFSELDVRLH